MTRSSLRSTVSRVLVGAVAVATLALGQAALAPATASAAGSSSQTVSTSNITATKTVTPAAALPGQTVEVKIRLEASGTDRYMQDFTDYAPADYVLQSVTARVWRSGPALGDWNKGGQYDGTPTQDASGAVAVNWRAGGNCAGGGCRLVLLDKGADLTFVYKVRDDASIGPRQTGMSFHVYSFNTEQAWRPLNKLSLSVAPFATTTTVPSLSPVTEGETATLKAGVAPAAATGTVQFRDGGVNIGVPVPVSNGQAQLPHTFEAVGDHDISAVFTGTGQYAGSTSGTTKLQVTERPTLTTTTTLQVPSSAVQGAPVTMTAWLDPAHAVGTVQFKENGAPIGAPVPVGGAAAQLSHAFTQLGSRSITAEFTGGKGFANSASASRAIFVSAPVTPDVATATSLTLPPTAQTGQPVTLTAVLDPAGAVGTVRFRDNGADVGDPVPVSGGVASLQHTFTTSGAHDVVAVFTAGAGFLGSTSAGSTVVVTDPAPGDVASTTTLTVPATASVGQAIQLTAQVSGAETLPGSVQFYDGATPIGTPQAVSGGTAVLTYTFLTPGARELTAVYSGGSGVVGSSSDPQPIQVTGTDTGGPGGTGSLLVGIPPAGS